MALRIFFVAALQVLLVAARPARRDAVVTVGAVPSDSQCTPFHSPVCNALGGQGYSYASFPNPLAPAYLPTHEKAEFEGNGVISLAVDSKCSPDVAIFLCFSFFPFCAENQFPVLPCKSLCERVRSDCEPYLNSTYNVRWPQWADCDNVDSVVSRNGGRCIREGPRSDTNNNTATPRPTWATTTPSPTSPPPTSPPVCGTCGPLSKVFSTTFRLQNSNYTFAAKVSVQSRNTTNRIVTYGVNVSKGFDLSCKAPVPQNIVIRTCDERCGPCLDLAVGKTYLIGGYSNVGDNGVVEWKVPCQNGVASPWSDDYDTKMEKWMMAAVKDRQCAS